MAFSNLPPQEKDAFFSLLDEYFTSRPDLLSRLASKNNVQPNSHPSPIHSAASAAQRAFSAHPPPAPKPAPPAQSRPSFASQASSADESADRVPAHATGRVAAAASAFSSSGAPAGSSPYHARTPSASGLTQQRKFGSDVDTSSAKGLYSSIRHGTANKSAPPPNIAPPPAPAFGRKQYGFAPPPDRAHHTGSSGDDDGAPPPPPPPAPPPPPMPAQHKEEEGEWAEALYDYRSDEAGDLELQANQRVRVLDRTSEDWWNGELEDGRKGLFPGSYVRLL